MVNLKVTDFPNVQCQNYFKQRLRYFYLLFYIIFFKRGLRYFYISCILVYIIFFKYFNRLFHIIFFSIVYYHIIKINDFFLNSEQTSAALDDIIFFMCLIGQWY